MVRTAKQIWADGPSGAPYQPFKPEIREWGTDIEERNGKFLFGIREDAVETDIGDTITSIEIRGETSLADGRGGVFISEDNGSEDTFITADGRTWYRNSIAIKAGHPEAVANSVMGVQYSLEEGAWPLKDEAGVWSGKTYAYFSVSKTFDENYDSDPDEMGFSGPTTALFVFANNDGAHGDVVGLLADAVARQSNGVVFGANLIARNDAGTLNTKLVGLEIDVEPAMGTTMANDSFGIIMNMFSIDGPASVMLVGGLGGGTWANGIILNHIRGAGLAAQTGSSAMESLIDATQGSYTHSAIALGKGASQAISLGGESFGVSPYFYGDTAGNTLLNMGAGGFLILQNPAGAQRFLFDQFGVFSMPNGGRIDVSGKQVIGQRLAAVSNAASGTEIATINSILARLRSHGLIES